MNDHFLVRGKLNDFVVAFINKGSGSNLREKEEQQPFQNLSSGWCLTWFIMRLHFLTLALTSLAISARSESCPGYALTDIKQTANSLTGSLSLAGDACNAYGEDIKDLRLLVEYQSGKWRFLNLRHTITKRNRPQTSC